MKMVKTVRNKPAGQVGAITVRKPWHIREYWSAIQKRVKARQLVFIDDILACFARNRKPLEQDVARDWLIRKFPRLKEHRPKVFNLTPRKDE